MELASNVDNYIKDWLQKQTLELWYIAWIGSPDLCNCHDVFLLLQLCLFCGNGRKNINSN